jgi:hypothetical protein
MDWGHLIANTTSAGENATATSEHKPSAHRLALMEKRMKVFDATIEFISLVLREAVIKTMDPLFRLMRDTRERDLLFGSEIGEYIDQLYAKGNRLRAVYAARGPGDTVRPEDIAVDAEINTWFSEQTGVVRDKFLRYLDFREP